MTHTRTFSADGDQDWTFSTTNDDHVHHDPLEPGDILKGGSAKMTVINQGAYLFLLFYVKNLLFYGGGGGGVVITGGAFGWNTDWMQ